MEMRVWERKDLFPVREKDLRVTSRKMGLRLRADMTLNGFPPGWKWKVDVKVNRMRRKKFPGYRNRGNRRKMKWMSIILLTYPTAVGAVTAYGRRRLITNTQRLPTVNRAKCR